MFMLTMIQTFADTSESNRKKWKLPGLKKIKRKLKGMLFQLSVLNDLTDHFSSIL